MLAASVVLPRFHMILRGRVEGSTLLTVQRPHDLAVDYVALVVNLLIILSNVLHIRLVTWLSLHGIKPLSVLFDSRQRLISLIVTRLLFVGCLPFLKPNESAYKTLDF